MERNHLVAFIAAGTLGLIATSPAERPADDLGAVMVSVSRASFDAADRVVVELTGIELERPGGARESFAFDPARRIDLGRLGVGGTPVLNELVPAGRYEWVRVIVGPGSYAELADGSRRPVSAPGADSLRLGDSYAVAPGGRAELALSFRLQPTDAAFLLRPSLRVLR